MEQMPPELPNRAFCALECPCVLPPSRENCDFRGRAAAHKHLLGAAAEQEGFLPGRAQIPSHFPGREVLAGRTSKAAHTKLCSLGRWFWCHRDVSEGFNLPSGVQVPSGWFYDPIVCAWEGFGWFQLFYYIFCAVFCKPEVIKVAIVKYSF